MNLNSYLWEQWASWKMMGRTEGFMTVHHLMEFAQNRHKNRPKRAVCGWKIGKPVCRTCKGHRPHGEPGEPKWLCTFTFHVLKFIDSFRALRTNKHTSQSGWNFQPPGTRILWRRSETRQTFWFVWWTQTAATSRLFLNKLKLRPHDAIPPS